MVLKEPKYPVNTLIKGINIYEIIGASEQPLTLTEINEICGYGLSTTHRFLDTLVSRGFVSKNESDNKYSLGIQSLVLGNKALTKFGSEAKIQEILQNLSNECHETVKLACLRKKSIIYLGVVESRSMLRSVKRIGDEGPAHCTSMGKLLLAFLPVEHRELILKSLNPLEKLTENTITSMDLLRENLNEIRRLGYAIDREEFELGLLGIAIPITHNSNGVQAALSISGPESRFTEQNAIKLLPKMQETAQLLSQLNLV